MLGSLAGVTGQAGEELIADWLVELGWVIERPRMNAPNYDLMAMRDGAAVRIQVKATDGSRPHSHADWVHFGYASHYLGGGSVFNRVAGYDPADVVVALNYRPGASITLVLPVAFAERICRQHCDYWHSHPKRDGTKRSPSFGIYLRYRSDDPAHGDHYKRLRTALSRFEDAWWVLSEPQAKLRDPLMWPL